MRNERDILVQGFDLHKQGKLDEAEVIYDRLLGYVDQPDPNVYTSLGMLLAQREKYGQAIHFLRRGLEGIPDHPGAWTNLGVCLNRIGLREAAYKAQEKACEVAPDEAISWSNHAAMYVNMGRPEKVLEFSQRALALDGNYPEAHNHYALGLLESGRFAEAWPHYDWRWDIPERLHQKRPYKCPKWDGSMVEMLSIHGEQGIGDEIMFMSLFREAQRRVRNVVIECMPRLIPWFQQVFGVPCYGTHEALINAQGEPDAHIAMGTLPRLFGMPNGKPYMPRRHKAIPGRIGLAWKGGTDKTNKRERSLKIEQLAPIRAIEGLEFVSIQYDGEVDAQRVGLRHGIKGKDFEALNDEIAKCDLVITPCQTAVHQAGSMGVDCWVMVPKKCAWRYAGEKMPWYNSVTFFRQDDTETWEPVVARIAVALQERYTAEAPIGEGLSLAG